MRAKPELTCLARCIGRIWLRGIYFQFRRADDIGMTLDRNDPIVQRALQAAERRAARKGTRQEFSARRTPGLAARHSQRHDLLARREREQADATDE